MMMIIMKTSDQACRDFKIYDAVVNENATKQEYR